MRSWVVLLITLLVGCSTSQPAASTSAGSGQASCRLPISISDNLGKAQGAFVTFPGGNVAIDPAGEGGVFYDRALKRWLAVPAYEVAADGSRYAYTERKVPGTLGEQKLHVVDLSTGSDKVYALSSANDTSSYVVIELATDSVWLTYSGYESPRGGLLVLDLSTGAIKDVGGGVTMFDAVAGGSGMFWYTDPGPHPQQSAGMGGVMPARVNRLNVSDGSTEAWFTKDGSYLTVLGTDLAGHPVVTDASTVWLATSPASSSVINVPAAYYAVFADAHGTWLGGSTGVFLYTPAGEVQRVTDQAASPVGACA